MFPDAGERDLTNLINYFTENDPSGNNKYLEWEIRAVANDTLVSPEKIVNVVDMFHKYQNSIEQIHVTSIHNVISVENPAVKKPRDINSYNYQLLVATLECYLEEKSSKKGKKDLSNQYDVILDNDDYLIAVPLSYEASKKLGQGTKWCVAAKETDNHFVSYTKVGTLYYVIDKVRTNPNFPLYKFAYYRKFVDSYGNVFNAPDSNIGNITDLLAPDICKLIDTYHNEQFDIPGVFDTLCHHLDSMVENNTLQHIPISDNDKLCLPLKIKHTKPNNKKNEYIYNIVGFDDWKYKITLYVNLQSIGFTISLLHKNRKYSDLTITDFTLNKIDIIQDAVSLKRTGDGSKVSHIFGDDFNVNMKNLYFQHRSFILHNLFTSLSSKVINDKWTVNMDTSVEDIQKYGSFSFKMKKVKSKGHYSNVSFDFDVKIESGNLVLEIDELSHGKHDWGCLLEYFKCEDITDENITKAFNQIVEMVKNHITKKDVKQKPVPELEFDHALNFMSSRIDSGVNGYRDSNWNSDGDYGYDGNRYYSNGEIRVAEDLLYRILDKSGDVTDVIRALKLWNSNI